MQLIFILILNPHINFKKKNTHTFNLSYDIQNKQTLYIPTYNQKKKKEANLEKPRKEKNKFLLPIFIMNLAG